VSESPVCRGPVDPFPCRPSLGPNLVREREMRCQARIDEICKNVSSNTAKIPRVLPYLYLSFHFHESPELRRPVLSYVYKHIYIKQTHENKNKKLRILFYFTFLTTTSSISYDLNRKENDFFLLKEIITFQLLRTRKY